MTDHEDGQAAATVARDVAIRLLAASKEAVAGGADVPAQYLGIFPTAYGWWRFICSHLSGMSHTSVETANAYLEWTGGGTFQIRDEAADPGPAAAIQLSVALLQAASVMNGLLADNPLQANIDAAAADLGLQGTALFHDRVR